MYKGLPSPRTFPGTPGFLRPRKRFGQNFLEPAWAAKVLRAIGPEPQQTFIEIGPGRGALTLLLARRVAHLVAVEIDRDLVTALRASTPHSATIVEGNFLEATSESLGAALEVGRVMPTQVRVAGNLPYNVASPILFKLVELFSAGLPLSDATVMLQREVADRLTARPGTRDYGVLTVLIGQRASVERLLRLPPGAFRPAPEVYSSLVRLTFHAPEPPAGAPAVFAAMVQAIFTRRRKTLANALLAFPPTERLRPAEALVRASIDGARRPESLTVAELVRLADVFASISGQAVL